MNKGEHQAAQYQAQQRPARLPKATEQYAPEEQFLIQRRQDDGEQRQEKRELRESGFDQLQVARRQVQAQAPAHPTHQGAQQERGPAREQHQPPRAKPLDRCP